MLHSNNLPEYMCFSGNIESLFSLCRVTNIKILNLTITWVLTLLSVEILSPSQNSGADWQVRSLQWTLKQCYVTLQREIVGCWVSFHHQIQEVCASAGSEPPTQSICIWWPGKKTQPSTIFLQNPFKSCNPFSSSVITYQGCVMCPLHTNTDVRVHLRWPWLMS